MLRALGFKREIALTDEEAAPLILQQAQDFEVALQAMDYLLDDRTDEGLHLISDESDSTIKTLANGVIHFLEATLGFEPEVMRKAGEVLSKAETLSARDRAKHQRMKLKSSPNFPPGTEYAVCNAEATLLNALVMLLSESMLDSAKALLKLRRAYQTLDELLHLIKDYERKKRLQGKSLNESSVSLSSATTNTSTVADVPFSVSQELLSDPHLTGLAEKVHEMRVSRLNGSHIGNTPVSERLRACVGYNSERVCDQEEREGVPVHSSDLSTIDEYIISGTNLCFGILQLVLSLIPPAIGKVLSVVGFKGSRENGLKMIWESVQGRNIHGCIGLLALLVFYDGPFQFTDADFDIPDSLDETRTMGTNLTSEEGLSLQRTKSLRIMRTESRAFQGIGKPTLLHPGKKLEDALLYARALFPNSALWLLQEARMLASRGRLEESLQLMDSIERDVKMVQVEALLVFDRVMILMFLHRYERAAQDIPKLIALNAWSPGLYTYIAASCYVELYRMCKMGLVEDMETLARKDEFAKKASDLMKKVPGLVKGVKKTMPFDKFLLRKHAEYTENMKKYNVSLIDAIGTSPTHELMYFWNGYNRMPEEHLQIAQNLLNYSVSECALFPEHSNHNMVRNLLRAITLRRLGDIDEGMKLLDEEVLRNIIVLQPENKKEPYRYIRHLEDPWLYPTAMYEKALFIWKQTGVNGLDSSKTWLTYAQGYSDDYELSTRVSMKIKAASDRLEGL
jgi:tetratricopeptide (TPR) repeat protein